MTITPLQFPTWSAGERFFSGFPGGASIERFVADELRKRGAEYVDLWTSAGDDVDRAIAFRVAAIIKSVQRHMPNDFFIPEDACQLLFIDDHDALTPQEVAHQIERDLAVTFTDVVWDECEHGTFADFIRELGKIECRPVRAS